MGDYMYRKKLKEIEDERKIFIGTFERYGIKSGYKCPLKTVLLLDIKDEEENEITDHLWFNFTKGFEKLGELKRGDKIKFRARSKKYTKGYQGYRWDIPNNISTDYKLSHPTILSKE